MHSNRILFLCLSLSVLLLWAGARAEDVLLPGTQLYLTMPSYTENSTAAEDTSCTADWTFEQKDGTVSELQVYVFSAGGQTLGDLYALEQEQNASDHYYSELTQTSIAGFSAIRAVSSAVLLESQWECISYILLDADQFVQMNFWYTGDHALDIAMLMDTLHTDMDTGSDGYVSGPVEIADSGYWVTLPAGTWSDPLTQEEQTSGMVACWYVGDLELQAHCYTDQLSLEELQSVLEADRNYTSCTRLTLADTAAICYRMQTTSDGQLYSCIGYALRENDTWVELVFWFPGETPPTEMEGIVSSFARHA